MKLEAERFSPVPNAKSPTAKRTSSAPAATPPGPAAPNRDWKIRIQPSDQTPYRFKATMVLRGGGSDALEVSYLYGDGDLAVFLEDKGAAAPAICGIIEDLRGRRTAEITVEITEQAMEVLTRRGPELGA